MRELALGPAVCVDDRRAVLGEGPLWDVRDAALYWLDIKGEALFRFDPGTGETAVFPAEGMISALAVCAAGGFVAASRNGFLRIAIEDGGLHIDPLADPEAGLPGNRFNDGKADPAGGFWAGTMDNAEEAVSGAWWRLAPDGATTRLAGGFMVTNGPAFDPERGRVFLTDSARRTIYVAPSDGAVLGDMEVFAAFGPDDGYPDGMEVDAQGCLWVAFWDGACLRRFDPDGAPLQEVALPTPRPTSLAFAPGAIYATSASIGLDPSAFLAGGLFRIEVDADLSPPQRAFKGV